MTLKDVAKLAGVNIATASRALSEDRRDLVSDETAQRVDDAARKLGYRPNPIARGLKTNRSYTVGVLVPDLTNPLYPPMVRGVDDVLGKAGYTPLVANTDNDNVHERMGYDALRARRVDGFIVATAFREHPLTEEALASSVPLVLVLRTVEGVDAPAISVDDRAGVEAAIQHLVDLGHREIAHVAGPRSMSTGFDRCEAFARALEERGLTTGADRIVPGGSYSIDEGRRACTQLLASGRRPTAILAGNDLMALGCLDALADAGLECPGDVSVVGYNDMPFADRFAPPLTTVTIAPYDLGARGATRLLEQLRGGDLDPVVELLTPRLIVRGSTGPAPRRRRTKRT